MGGNKNSKNSKKARRSDMTPQLRKLQAGRSTTCASNRQRYAMSVESIGLVHHSVRRTTRHASRAKDSDVLLPYVRDDFEI